ncbi:TPA: GTP pyrophosphokinase, partial [Enterobacter chengduensis]|nr:GTP pyrophosphokinase [Enterobacter chengduensis]
TMKRVKDEQQPGKIKFEVSVTPYRINQADEALEALKRDDANPEVPIAVLLATESVKSLKKAYPNYLGSTNQFARFLSKHIK